ncbi:MAG: class I SAM-dependent methyltransferase [Candidatus Schekmanbacteria bacterium]|nr:class I SAM-dependent methyltransferase [Candidatus Schekmanbacteria bacterium]
MTDRRVDGAAVFVCPRCRAGLSQVSGTVLGCENERLEFPCVGGTWRFLTPEREVALGRFMEEYATVRRAEGRGSDDDAYYRALPFADRSGRFTRAWKIRARSFRALIRTVVTPLERFHERALDIVDLGAGNCWMSHRLAARGHSVLAVDLQVDERDGLGAYPAYAGGAGAGSAPSPPFTPVQADLDALPLPGESVDLAVYNASFHYSTGYERSLGEALRVVRSGGQVVIMDTPLYSDPASGVAMVREREADFCKRYGFPSNAIACENFLTASRVAELERSLGLAFACVTPFYGVRWALRPLEAKLRGWREPARFALLVTTRGSGGAPGGGRARD